MKKLLILVVLVVGGYCAWNFAFTKSPAIEAYESFANAAMSGSHQMALSYTDGPGFNRMFATRKSKQSFSPPFMEAFHGASYEYTSVIKSDNKVDLHVTQTVRYTPPGTESAMGGTMADRFTHEVTMELRGSDWKLTSFESTPLGTIASR